jgi:hypothetical protein
VSPDAAPSEFLQPPSYLPVIVQVRILGPWPQINSMQQPQCPPGQLIPLKTAAVVVEVLLDPTRGPPVGSIAAHPALKQRDETSLDLIQTWLLITIHTPQRSHHLQLFAHNAANVA